MNEALDRSTRLLLMVVGICACFAGSTSSADENREKSECLSGQMTIVETIKPGMTAERLLDLFNSQRGLVRVVTEDGLGHLRSSGEARVSEIDTLAWTFCLKSCPLIKIDVQFAEPIISASDAKPGNKIKWVSKPYLGRPYY